MHANTKLYPTLLLFGNILLASACGKHSDNNQTDQTPNSPQDNSGPQAGSLAITLTADGVNSALESAGLTLAGVTDENYGYPGIGMNYGESIVEGFKIKLLGAALQTINEETGGWGSSAAVIDFGQEGKELEISSGFNGKIEVKADVNIPPGKYTQVGINVKNEFSLKAYAYLDRDNDGTIDTTIWTTPDEIKMQAQKLAPGAMPAYGWYRYPWLVATMAKSLTDNSAFPIMHSTTLPEPILVTESGVVSGDSMTKNLSLTLLIDTFRIIKVWDGRYAAGNNQSWIPGSGNPSILPAPVFPFPQGDNDTRNLNGPLKTYDFYPPNKPSFALGNYLSIFGFVNQTGIKAHNYVISKTGSITPYNSQFMTILFDGTGIPFFGKSSLGEANDTLHIGPVARRFEQKPDQTFSFGTAYGEKDENGKWDGGLYYSYDLARAGHLFSGFRKLTIGQRSQMTMMNGPRCKAEYDYCVDPAGVPAYYLRAQ